MFIDTQSNSSYTLWAKKQVCKDAWEGVSNELISNIKCDK
jgi:hypothetical protein